MENSIFFRNIAWFRASQIIKHFSRSRISFFKNRSFFLASPLFGYKIIPLQVRIVVSFATSFLIFNSIPIPNIIDLSRLNIVLVIFQELVIGISSGLLLKYYLHQQNLQVKKLQQVQG